MEIFYREFHQFRAKICELRYKFIDPHAQGMTVTVPTVTNCVSTTTLCQDLLYHVQRTPENEFSHGY